MKTLLALLLLIPSLSWGNQYLINLINEIHDVIKTEDLISSQADFYLERLSIGTNDFQIYGVPCYDALILSQSKDTYYTNSDCKKIRSILGFSTDEYKSNLKKIREILNYFYEYGNTGKFYKGDDISNDIRKKNIENLVKNVTVLHATTSLPSELN